MLGLLDTVGVDPTCFSRYSAENEPDIDQYFVRPPYYSEVLKRGLAQQSLILFGERGAGKSASRIAFYKESWASVSKNEKAPLVVCLSDYSRILSGGLANVALGSFVSEVGFLVSEAILLWLSALEDEVRQTYLGSLTDNERASIASLVNHFWLAQSAAIRDSSIEEPLKLLNLAWHSRTKMWIENRWDAVRSLIGDLAKIALKKGLDVDSKIDESLKDLLGKAPTSLSNEQFSRALLQKLVASVKTLGFNGIVVAVDKVDETPITGNSYENTAKVLFPLLATTTLLELDGLGWLFFLWDKAKISYDSGALKVRLDKIANAPIQWERDQLETLVTERLRHFSRAGATVRFSHLCEEGVDASGALRKAIELSMNSPRELIRILDTIIREHDEQRRRGQPDSRLTIESIDKGFDKYVRDRLPTVFDEIHVKYVARIGKKTFINKDVQQAFKIGDQGARARIDNWSKAGLVRFIGVRASDGEAAGKPPNEYAVADTRMVWAVERKLYDSNEVFEESSSEDVSGLGEDTAA